MIIVGFVALSLEKRYRIILHSTKQKSANEMRVACSDRCFKIEIVRCCMEQKLINVKEMASDGSYIPAEVSRNRWIDIEVEIGQSMLSYLDDLD